MMRSLLVALAVVAFAAAAAAQDAPPPPLDEPPPAVEVPPLEAAPGEAPPAPIETPTQDGEPDFVPAPAPKPGAKPKAPPPDEATGGFGGAACWGSTLGCLGAGCLPGAGTAVGAAVLYTFISAAVADGGCGGIVLVVLGVVYGGAIGVPSALLLGPCATCAAVGGGVTGAVIDDRDVTPVLLGSIPGAVAALLGTAGIVWGVLSLDGAVDYTLPVAILGTSAALQLLSGPVTVAGIVIADAIAGESAADAGDKPAPKPDDPRQDPGTATVAMRY